MSRKHIPQRTCVICRIKQPKARLKRLVYTDSGIQLDVQARMVGRGAYLCHQLACWQKATDSSKLNHALRVSLSQKDEQILQQYMSNL